MFFSMDYFLLVAIPGMVLAGAASFFTKSTFQKYSKVAASSRINGAQAAHTLLERNGVNDVKIEMVQGFLTDHYDPRSKTLRLSPQVYEAHSLSAIGVACHEAGHALQHAQGYKPLSMRSQLVPATTLGSNLSMPIIMIGLFLSGGAQGAGGGLGQILLLAGIALFSLTVLFAFVTLPVEYDASARAKKLMVSSGIVSHQEQVGAGRVLNAAFLTYLASAISALLTLLYFLFKAGLIGGRKD